MQSAKPHPLRGSSLLDLPAVACFLIRPQLLTRSAPRPEAEDSAPGTPVTFPPPRRPLLGGRTLSL
jgi:hypothetical protein